MSPTRSTEERPMVDFRKLPTRQEDVPIYRLHKEVDDVLSTPRKVKESVDNTLNTGKNIVDGAFSLIAGGAVASAVQGAQELVAKAAPPPPPPKAPAPKAAAKKEIDPAEAQKANFKVTKSDMDRMARDMGMKLSGSA
ncbi:hypothetical protein AK812_SmicGene42352 [Symbiodinium microadriaticum]|uniref:Uncharacterized protein n=1 Tax=Symbiodinium microadriaticum TaxID=2951 RepID=A0A1Q9C3U1_SYMMI|nr:hypothetical protein AK812_SmicGene42352 [Symbiodinium microadriaticum]